jgi:nucleoside triphosphate pyrophosphatase
MGEHMVRQIILASGSPRRKELLARMGVEFTVMPSDFDEYLDHDRPPAEVAAELGLGKARAVARKHPDALVLGSDTIVTIGGRQLAKPEDINDARAMLRAHAGQAAIVSTSIIVICMALGMEDIAVDETVVQFKPYDAAATEQYLAIGDWHDKAGGWGIQSGAAPLISHIVGNYDTVVGLPTQLLADMLRKHGVKARPVRLASPVPQEAERG